MHAGVVADFTRELCLCFYSHCVYGLGVWLYLKTLLKMLISHFSHKMRSENGSWGALFMILARKITPWVPRVVQS